MMHKRLRLLPLATFLLIQLATTAYSPGTSLAQVKKPDPPGVIRIPPIERPQRIVAPDLVVTSATFTPANPTMADAVMINVQMKNQGQGAAIIPGGASEWVASKPGGGGGGQSSNGGSIAPGATFSRGLYIIQPGDLQPGTHQIRVKVDPDNRCVESNENNNELVVSLTIAQPDPVDLVITEMVLEPAQITTTTDFRVKVTVKNQGTGTARFPPESLILGGPDLNFQYAWGQGETFGPGVSKTYRLIKGDPRVGTFIWKTIVDPGHKVIETNENNNEKTIQVVVGAPIAPAGPLPDLVVTSATFTPANPTMADAVMINVQMKNQGQGAAIIPGGASEWTASKPGGGSCGQSSNGGSIAPGATFSRGLYIIQPGDLQPGTHQIRVKVDPDNRCVESNENNNELVVSLTIAQPDPVDLVITEMVLEPAQITTTTDFRVKVTVKNQGTGTARFPPESLILGGPDLNFQYAWGQGETFGPGVSKTYRLIKGDPRVGTFIWKTIVDPGHKVIETNENNNEKTIQVTIDH